jgi:hypothetical protein
VAGERRRPGGWRPAGVDQTGPRPTRREPVAKLTTSTTMIAPITA